MPYKSKTIKHDEALARDAERAKRSPEQQLKHLDALLGVGVGAKTERARLAQQIASRAIKAKAEEKKKEPVLKTKPNLK